MKIVVIDVRHGDGCGRAQHLAGTLTNAGHCVSVSAHVNGEHGNAYLRQPYQEWPNDLKEAILAVAGESLILLHVGREQSGAEAALRECYRAKYVICFSGSTLPAWCLADCRANQLHGSIFGEIPADNQWPEWSVQQLLKACRLIESNDWTSARNAVCSFDPRLEENLDVLYSALKNNTSNDNLLQLRQRLLGS